MATLPSPRARGARWIRFVQDHGVVLATGRGLVPSVAAAVAGAPLTGDWRAHPRAPQIAAALAALDRCADVRCFRLIAEQRTYVHRRIWPALARLAHDGVLDPTQVACLQQEALPGGDARTIEIPFPDWLPDAAAAAAHGLTAAAARSQLGPALA